MKSNEDQREPNIDELMRRWIQPDPLCRRAAEEEAASESGSTVMREQYAQALDGCARLRVWALECLASGDWPGFSAKLPRRFRVEALFVLGRYLSDPDYWRALHDEWLGCDSLWQYDAEVRELLFAARPEREFLMTPDEAARLAALPANIVVYRGAQQRLNRKGWSWALSEANARFYLNYYRWWEGRVVPNRKTSPVLLRARVRRADIVALFESEEWTEIVVPPELVRGVVKVPFKDALPPPS